MGEAGEGMNISAPAEEAGGEVARGVPRSLPHPDPRRSHRGSALLQAAPTTRPSCVTCTSAARRSAAILPARCTRRTAARGPRPRDLREAARGLGRSRVLDHDGVRAHALRAAARSETRSPRGADRPRRSAHLRHGGPVPPARHLRRRRPALRARRSRPGDVVPRGPEGPGAPGGHHAKRARCRRGSRPAPATPTTACR